MAPFFGLKSFLLSSAVPLDMRSAFALLAAAVLLAAPQLPGQAPAPEFTRQGLLIPNFEPGDGADTALGRRVAEVVRSRLGRLVNRREVEVYGTGEIRLRLERAGFDSRGVQEQQLVEQLGRYLRADEYVIGTIEGTPGGIRAMATLVLMRDARMRQPLQPTTGADVEELAESLARRIADARVQLAFQRRCENSLRDGRGGQAIRHAREGVAAYREAALARICLVQALRLTESPARELLAVSRELLAIDPISFHGLEAAAMALDSLQQREEAASMWTRLQATDTSDLGLLERVVWALHENENSRAAEPLIVRYSNAHPDTVRLLHLRWRVVNANQTWSEVVSTGESLIARDSAVLRDSTFHLRLALAYQSIGRPYDAIATAARGVALIPEAARLYAVYAQLVRAEADSVLPRGIALHPRSADLLALNARVLRTQGRLDEALEATRMAVELAPSADGALSLAQALLDLGQPDSALASLRRMVVAEPDSVAQASDAADAPNSGLPRVVRPQIGGDSTRVVVAQFALSKGNTLLRAADATKRSRDFRLAMGFLALADTLVSSPQSRFLLGTAALGGANAAVTEAAAAQRAESCELLRGGAELLPVARHGLEGGREVAPEAANQYLAYAGQMEPYVQQQLATLCGGV